MRRVPRFAVAIAASVCVGFSLPASAQDKAQDQGGNGPPPKQVALTQKQIDDLVAAQKDIRDIQSKVPQADQDKADPKLDAKIDEAIKKDGFSGMEEFGSVSYSIGMVLGGMDPASGNYVGAQAVIKKQMAEVKADKKMPPKEKKEALEELQNAMQAAGDEKPLPGNVDLVKKNAAKLSEGTQQAD